MNTRNPDAALRVDFHTHILPGLDDGAKELPISLDMLRALRAQKVETVALTPHFYPHRETLSAFLERRENAWRELCSAAEGRGYPTLLLGAEIYLTPGLAEMDLRALCIGDTGLLLVEMPRQSYRPWMIEEICNLTFSLGVRPVIAHVERYLPWYSREDYEGLFSFGECLYQFNAEGLEDKRAVRLLRRLAEEGRPLLIGSDAHNLTDRAPDFTRARQCLQKKPLRAVACAVEDTLRALEL